MQFHLHNDVRQGRRSALWRPGTSRSGGMSRQTSPQTVRAHVARVLVGAAERVDRESARRALA